MYDELLLEQINSLRDSLKKVKKQDNKNVSDATRSITGTELVLYLKRELDHHIFSQEKAKRILSTTTASFISERKNRPATILFIGPTGCGKSYMMQCLEKAISMRVDNIGFIYKDGSHFSPEGFQGGSTAAILKEMKTLFASGKKKVVCFIDEIDKLISVVNRDISGTNVNQIVQDELLGYLSCQSIEGIEFKNVMFVFAGCFEQLRKESREQKKVIGFTSATASQANVNDGLGYRCLLLQSGTTSPEFMGRIDKIVVFNELDDAALKAVLESELEKTAQEFKKYNIQLEISQESKQLILEQSKAYGIGARSMRATISDLLDDKLYEAIEHGESEVYVQMEWGYERGR